jgi:hypothetical protein
LFGQDRHLHLSKQLQHASSKQTKSISQKFEMLKSYNYFILLKLLISSYAALKTVQILKHIND